MGSAVLFRLVLSVAFCLVLTPLARAEEVKQLSSSAAAKSTPITQLDAATDIMMKGLDDNQLKQFAAIQNSHGTIRAVEDVQQSIARAVVSCSKANPDMKDPMSSRFEEWKNAIRPVMGRARTKLDKMILLQNFSQPSHIRAYLKKFDAAVIYRNQGIKPVAISKKDECDKLQGSMAKTQNDLVNLLEESLGLNVDLKVKE